MTLREGIDGFVQERVNKILLQYLRSFDFVSEKKRPDYHAN